uniref:Uncharacterized protein n=1 Tax=Pseudoalteromonas rubra TaxID=43658 RepID=A0A0F4Q999_9GAMM|nr:hypothetical protein TW77_23610 [Pseudoalteromonas rubra]
MKLKKRKIKNLSASNEMLTRQTNQVAGGFAAISGQGCDLPDTLACNSQACLAPSKHFQCIESLLVCRA